MKKAPGQGRWTSNRSMQQSGRMPSIRTRRAVIVGRDECREDVTFSDPVGWPETPPPGPHLPDGARAIDRDLDLPPLPTLAPLPALRPMTPMPRPPWETEREAEREIEGTATAAPPASAASASVPPPPAGHPAARLGHAAVAQAGSDESDGPVAPPVTEFAAPAAPGGPLLGRHAGATLPETARLEAPLLGAALPETALSDSSLFGSGLQGVATQSPEIKSASASGPVRAQALRVVVIGGAEPLGGMIAERLIAAGHRIAVHDVTIPANNRLDRSPASATFRTVEPISLQGDRSDSEDVVHTVARAEVALGGLDAIVVLPARQRFQTSLDADAATWADEWSAALTTEVLAAACASHIAARSFMARRRAGRIVLVAGGRDGAPTGAMPTSVTRAAIARLGADLTRELGPHGIGVSVVTTGPGGTQDFAMTQVADVVEALLATPVLSSVTSQVG